MKDEIIELKQKVIQNQKIYEYRNEAPNESTREKEEKTKEQKTEKHSKLQSPTVSIYVVQEQDIESNQDKKNRRIENDSKKQ